MMKKFISFLLFCLIVCVWFAVYATYFFTPADHLSASSPRGVVWHESSEDNTYVVVYTRVVSGVTRCYLMNRAGGQPIQIECPVRK